MSDVNTSNATMTEAEVKFSDEKMRAEISKLISDTSKLNSENRWYPLVVGSGLTLAIITVVKLFL